VKLAPARLAPVFVPRLWGARNLAPLFAAPAGGEPVGEVWLTGERCALAGGAYAGRSLGEAWPAMPPEWTGTCIRGAPRIPLLVKFIFPEDKLSVQVHPDDEYARRHEAAAGGSGKTEMWYAVSARDGAELRLGLEDGVTRERFRQALTEGTAERCLRSFAVRAGDAFFVPAGTAHTIGPGMALCEVQQHSDITYRVFDYHRVQADGMPRPLHIPQALEVMRFGEQSGGRCEPLRAQHGAVAEELYAACRYFAVERWEFARPVERTTTRERFELLIVLSGRGRVESGGEAAAYGPAEGWFLPAGLGTYRLAPETATTLLRAYVPDLDELARGFTERGIDRAQWARVVHT
jgi:mannose-6-phosphate isomerase